MIYLRTLLAPIPFVILFSVMLNGAEFPENSNAQFNHRFLSVAQKNENIQNNFSWVVPYNTFSWLYAHKFRTLGIITATGVIGIQAYIWSLEYTIENHQWSDWNQNYSLEELQALSDSAMQKELLRDIKRTYPCRKHDYATAFLAFLDALTREETDIEKFQAITNSLTRIPMLFFINYNAQIVQQCPQRLAQIRYLRKRLINSFIKES